MARMERGLRIEHRQQRAWRACVWGTLGFQQLQALRLSRTLKFICGVGIEHDRTGDDRPFSHSSHRRLEQ